MSNKKNVRKKFVAILEFGCSFFLQALLRLSPSGEKYKKFVLQSKRPGDCRTTSERNFKVQKRSQFLNYLYLKSMMISHNAKVTICSIRMNVFSIKILS